MGAVPLKAPKRSRLAKRMTSPVMPTIVAATTGPTPKTSVWWSSKRRVGHALYARLLHDARRATKATE
jgi:hypothetical protein